VCDPLTSPMRFNAYGKLLKYIVPLAYFSNWPQAATL